MKLATHVPDAKPGWQIKQPNVRAWVWLNDEKVRYCVAADDGAGEVWTPARDKAGNIKIEKDEIVLERREGKVEIRFLNDKFERNPL